METAPQIEVTENQTLRKKPRVLKAPYYLKNRERSGKHIDAVEDTPTQAMNPDAIPDGSGKPRKTITGKAVEDHSTIELYRVEEQQASQIPDYGAETSRDILPGTLSSSPSSSSSSSEEEQLWPEEAYSYECAQPYTPGIDRSRNRSTNSSVEVDARDGSREVSQNKMSCKANVGNTRDGQSDPHSTSTGDIDPARANDFIEMQLSRLRSSSQPSHTALETISEESDGEVKSMADDHGEHSIRGRRKLKFAHSIPAEAGFNLEVAARHTVASTGYVTEPGRSRRRSKRCRKFRDRRIGAAGDRRR
ncbi:hypothetical protein TruAng_011896 [Truncatella angustata]|nr:hypothetical protein TruAng_011896 [Truncatella angustata]